MDFQEKARSLRYGSGVKLLAVNEDGLMAVDKPAGILSHPNSGRDESKSVLKYRYDLKEQCYQVESDGELEQVFLINRLDSATSGVLILALDAKAGRAAKEAFSQKNVRKVYEALVFGAWRAGNPIWRDRVSTRKAEGGVRSETGGGARAETKVLGAKPIPGVPLMSLLKLMPVTGKTHQLRLQAAKRGLPIVGDRTYGDFAKNKQVAKAKRVKRLCLHCLETRIEYRLGGVAKRFEARSKSPFAS